MDAPSQAVDAEGSDKAFSRLVKDLKAALELQAVRMAALGANIEARLVARLAFMERSVEDRMEARLTDRIDVTLAERLDAMEGRIQTRLEEKLEAMEGRLVERFEAMETRIATLEEAPEADLADERMHHPVLRRGNSPRKRYQIRRRVRQL
jgi:hypothetical protein